MKTKSLLIVAIIFCTQAFAQEPAVQDTSWKKGGLFSLNFGQTSLNNWAGGGFNSISSNAILSYHANYLKDGVSWDNSLDLGYGLLKQGEGDVVKTDDRIELNSKYGRQAWSENWYYSVLGNFRTQFAEGLGTPFATGDTLDGVAVTDTPVISNFLAPAYGLLALGLDYKPNENFTLFISPVTAKFTIVGIQDLADAGAFGVEGAELNTDGTLIEGTGSNTRSELGAYLRAAYSKEIMKNITLGTRLDLFTNYKENPFTHTDVNWELLLGMKVNKYISATFGLQAIYDHDIDIEDDGKVGPRTQFKQLFGIGFNYAL